MRLQTKFGCDFTQRKKEIDKMVMDYADSMQNQSDQSEDDDEEEEEKPAPPPKRQATKRKKAASNSDASSGNDSGDDYKPERKAKAKATAKSAARKTKKDGTEKKTGRKGTGFTRPYKLSPQLAAVVGDDFLPRHEVVKRVWAIINERNLYDPKNKQFAICDSQLQSVMGVKRFRTFAMLKYLKTHFLG